MERLAKTNTPAEKTALRDRCDIGSARENLFHIQFITLSA
jgi:hypothetical protein